MTVAARFRFLRPDPNPFALSDTEYREIDAVPRAGERVTLDAGKTWHIVHSVEWSLNPFANRLTATVDLD